jgi:hypothetical protein
MARLNAVADSAESRAQLQKALDAMAQTGAELQRSIDAAVAEAPAHFLPANPNAALTLDRKVTFDFADTDLTEAADFCAQISGMRIMIDKPLTMPKPPRINLRVTDMPIALALDWISKLENGRCVVRGKVAVITTTERAEKLLQEERVYAVAPPPGEAAYSVEELNTIALLTGAHARVTPDGKLAVRASDHAGVAKIIGALGDAVQKPADAEEWTRDLDRKLQRKVTFEFTDQSFEDCVNFLNSLTKVNIIIDPATVQSGKLKAPFTLKASDIPLADALSQLCLLAPVSITYSNQALFISDHPQLPRTLCVFELSPAIKAGVGQAELQPALQALLAGSPFKYPAPLFLRTRMIAEIDEWTARSVQAVIDGAADTKKIPAAPPEPWFFKTFNPGAPAKPDSGDLRR